MGVIMMDCRTAGAFRNKYDIRTTPPEIAIARRKRSVVAGRTLVCHHYRRELGADDA